MTVVARFSENPSGEGSERLPIPRYSWLHKMRPAEGGETMHAAGSWGPVGVNVDGDALLECCALPCASAQ